MKKTYIPPFYIIYHTGWTQECLSLYKAIVDISGYAGRLGKKHRVTRYWEDGEITEKYEWIIRDSMGSVVEPDLALESYQLVKRADRREKSWFANRARLQARASERNLPIPFANNVHRYTLGSRTVQRYIQHHRLYVAHKVDIRMEHIECGEKVKKFKAPNLKHEPYPDVIFLRKDRSWKSYRKHQWK